MAGGAARSDVYHSVFLDTATGGTKLDTLEAYTQVV